MYTMKANVTAMSVMPGASTASTKITEELLQCRLCSLKYRVDGRRPMALRCVHTFCEVCLEQLIRDQTDENQKQRRNKRQQLICPTCETITPLGRGCTPSSLPVNPSVMELLGIFDRPKVCSNEVAPGFSQVKVGTTTSRSHGSATTNGQLGQELNGTVSALMRNKIDPHYGLDLTNHCLYGDGNIEETGGGAANHVNWVSTVSIVGSAPQQQHKRRQQQQQHGSTSFSASKVSPAPAAMTSAVTSVSTLKMPPHQSSSTLSHDDVLSRETVAGPSSIASGVANVCCRCNLRPAAVSVARSSQTMAPQKLCSTCCNQTATRRSNDEQKPAAATGVVQQNARMLTKQPDNFVIAASKAVSAANVDPASETFTKRQINEAVNTRPQVVQDDKAKNIDNSGSLNRVKPTAAGFAVNRTSTIEVRRRSSYIENRSCAARTSTQDSDRCLNGISVDQPVQSTTVQTLSTSTGSKPRQTSAASVQQRPAVLEDTPPDVQPDAVLVPISEEMPTSPGLNAGTGSNIRELGERCSAPSITEIHPLPCNNPPYNPDFEQNRNATWSSTQHQERTPDTPAAGRLGLNPNVLGHKEEHERKQQPPDISGTARSGVALSFLMSNSRHQYPAEQPPKYEDIINENDAVTATAPEVHASQTQAVLHTPTEPAAAAVSRPRAMKLVRSFGKYGEISTQPGAFRTPGCVSVSSAVTTEENSTRIVVGDSANGTVQVFSDAGECLSMLRADAVRSCCLIDNSRLLIATDRGVEVSSLCSDDFCNIITANNVHKARKLRSLALC